MFNYKIFKMKKIKSFVLGTVLATTLFFSTPSEAKVIAQFCHIFPNGCIGTHTIHQAFFGLITWETYEVVACP